MVILIVNESLNKLKLLCIDTRVTLNRIDVSVYQYIFTIKQNKITMYQYIINIKNEFYFFIDCVKIQYYNAVIRAFLPRKFTFYTGDAYGS
jgi:hypothetical protein